MNNTPTTDPGDAWRYADKLQTVEAQRLLLQAALHALLTVRHARTKVNPEEVGTAVDWRRVEVELSAALRAAGHPAGDVETAAPMR